MGWALPFFSGKHVLVSGGTSGIGQAIAAGFAEAGAQVAATGGTQAEIEAAPKRPGLSYGLLDVRDGEAVRGFVSAFDRIDVLVNCAGINRRREEYDPDVFSDVIDINLNGVARMCAASRGLMGAGGAVLNIASMYSFFGAPHAPGYAASKGGVMQLTKALAADYAAEGIRVNALAPGWINTAMTAPLRADPERYAGIGARTPMGRWGEPADMAGAALFLCSPLAGFITGVTLPVDGGYLIA